MGKKINLIGSSNYLTNSTCVFGSMAGLAPTTNVRPMVTSLPGYKFARAAANGTDPNGNITTQSSADRSAGCGLGRFEVDNCTNARGCIQRIRHSNYAPYAYRAAGTLLG